MELVEQIARALAEAAGLDWDAMPESKTDDVPADECRETYRCLAQAVLPFIDAERERCAGVAAAHYSELGRDAEHHHREGNQDSLSRCQARMRSASLIEAAIRSQP